MTETKKRAQVNEGVRVTMVMSMTMMMYGDGGISRTPQEITGVGATTASKKEAGQTGGPAAGHPSPSRARGCPGVAGGYLSGG